MSFSHSVIEPIDLHPHHVQLYGADERFLVINVSRYIRDGLTRGEGVLVFATPQHSAAFAAALESLDVDVEVAIGRRQLTFCDAAETLAAFMRHEQLDAARFEIVIGSAVRKTKPVPGRAGMRAYGEMVGLLWSGGKHQQAIDLEELWNALLPSIGLQLFCGYPIDIFEVDPESAAVKALLHAHTHLLPTGENGALERAITRALHDFPDGDGAPTNTGTAGGALRPSVAMPRAETAVFALSTHNPESATRILSRARHYYQTEKRFRALIENSSDGISLMDATGKIQYASASVARILGYTPEQIVGGDGLELMHPEEADQARMAFERALKTPRSVVRFEARMRRSDGHWIWVDSTLNNVLDEPEVNGIVWNYRDISERKATEAALRHANAGLEQFAYAAAHDLQEPIRNVALYTELLAKRYQDKLDGDANKFLGVTLEGARRLQTLIQDLLAYTHALQTGSDEQKLTDAGQVLEEVLFNLATVIQEADATVVCGPLPKLPIYRAHLVQLFQNLISNALKYRSEELPRVRISVQEVNDEFRVAIEDNGRGIAADHRERIFGVFKRLHGRDIPGNGMGLAICNRIIFHYRGRIWVESAPGKGAKFVFTLPRRSQSDHG